MGRTLLAGTRRYVLDANALVGLFEDRKGIAEKVEQLLRQALLRELPLLMSAVNWGEVFYIEWRYRGEAKAREAEAWLQELPIAVIGVDRERASGRVPSNKSTAWVTPTRSLPNWLLNAVLGWSPPIRNSPEWGKRCPSIRCRDTRDRSPWLSRIYPTRRSRQRPARDFTSDS